MKGTWVTKDFEGKSRSSGFRSRGPHLEGSDSPSGQMTVIEGATTQVHVDLGVIKEDLRPSARNLITVQPWYNLGKSSWTWSICGVEQWSQRFFLVSLNVRSPFPLRNDLRFSGSPVFGQFGDVEAEPTSNRSAAQPWSTLFVLSCLDPKDFESSFTNQNLDNSVGGTVESSGP